MTLLSNLNILSISYQNFSIQDTSKIIVADLMAIDELSWCVNLDGQKTLLFSKFYGFNRIVTYNVIHYKSSDVRTIVSCGNKAETPQ